MTRTIFSNFVDVLGLKYICFSRLMGVIISYFTCPNFWCIISSILKVLKSVFLVSNRYCGKSIPPSLTSSTNSLMLKFVADADLAYEGFLISYEATNASTGNRTTLYTWFRSFHWKNVLWECFIPKPVVHNES